MKVCLIPPFGLENYVLTSRMHLTLALPELVERRTYRDMYARAARLGDYIIVDNGAAEGSSVTPTELITAADKFGAEEIVLPDSIRDMALTVKYAGTFFDHHGGLNGYRYQGVAQGVNMKEIRICISRFADMPGIEVLGLPRHLLTTLAMPSARIDLANEVAEQYPDRFRIHFLGTTSAWVSEIRHAAKYCGHVRSVDTSMPFNYAINGYVLNGNGRVRINRPRNYFTWNWGGRASAKLVRTNIETFIGWAGTV